MPITVKLDRDVALAAEELARCRGITFDKAVHVLIRAGLQQMAPQATPFKQQTKPVGIHVDARNVAEVLEILDDTDY